MSKALVAKALSQRVKDGEVIGLGSGSTVELAVLEIGRRVKEEGLNVVGIPTSIQIAQIAEKAGVQVLSSLSSRPISWAFDGADEIDGNFNMIKGRGGAMLAEKIMARRAGKNFVIIVDESKVVAKLGSKFPIPVEVIPEAQSHVEAALKALGASAVVVRPSSEKYGPLITEHNNIILDAKFENIQPELDTKIKLLTGVVEHGLFIGCTEEVLIAKANEVVVRKLSGGKLSESVLV